MFEDSKFAYFSSLAKAGELTLTPLGKIRKSAKKNSFTGEDMWNLNVNADGNEGTICLDKHAMAKQLEVYAGNEITVQFSREGKEQKLTIIQAPEGMVEEAPAKAAGAPQKRSKLSVKQGLVQITNAIWLAKKAVAKLHEQQAVDFPELVDATSSLSAFAADLQSVMIYLNSHGLTDSFPTDYQIWSPAQKAEAQVRQEAIEEEAKKVFKAKPAPEPAPVVHPEPEEEEPKEFKSEFAKNEQGEYEF